MSSLLQFTGEVTRKGVILEMYRTRENPRYSGSAICGDIIEVGHHYIHLVHGGIIFTCVINFYLTKLLVLDILQS